MYGSRFRWIACVVCVYVCLCPCSAAPFLFALQLLFRCAAIIGFLAADRCLVPWWVYTDSALAPCLVLLVFMYRHYVAGKSSVEGPPVPVRRKCRQDMEARRGDAQGQDNREAAQQHRVTEQQSTPTAKTAETPAALRILSLAPSRVSPLILHTEAESGAY